MGIEIGSDNPTILTGFKGGATELSRTGMRLVEKLDVGNAEDRQRVFYKGIAGLGTGEYVFTNWWQQAGAASALIGEFEVAAINSPSGTVSPEVITAYSNRIKTYMAMMATWSMVTHSDGTLAAVPNYMAPAEMGDAYAWKGNADVVAKDHAVGFALNWVEQWAEDGYLFDVLRKEKENPGSLAKWQAKVAEMLKADPGWNANRAAHSIASGIEDAVVTIAMTYFMVEDLPQWCEAIERGYHFPDTRGTGIQAGIDVSKPHLGIDSDHKILPKDEIFWHGLARPTDVLSNVKEVYMDPRLMVNGKTVISLLDGALTFNGGGLKGKGKGEARPSEFSFKDMKRNAALFDLTIGGPQGHGLADFSKAQEGVENLSNLYVAAEHGNVPRSDAVGWVVGEILAAKILASVGGKKGNSLETLGQVVNAIIADPNSTKEVQSLAVTLLGTDLKGINDGLIASLSRQFSLNVWTKELTLMADVLRLGIRDTKTVEALRKSKAGPILGGIATAAGILSDISHIADGTDRLKKKK